MIRSSRRDFLATTSLALASSVLRARDVRAQPRLLPASIVHSSRSAASWLPERIAPVDLHMLADAALEAARHAGARYADVRVAEVHWLRIHAVASDAALPQQVGINVRFLYGVRVLVDGAWAFVHGNVPSADALAAAARSAVATARGCALWSSTPRSVTHELASTPVVTGEWVTPMQLDPFTVSIGDQTALLSACASAAARVRNAELDFPSFSWTREMRAFASSEGSRTTQTLCRLHPEITSRAGFPWMDGVKIPILGPISGGYECVTALDLQDAIKAAAEDAARLIQLPLRPLEVGRYPLVLDGATLGNVLAATIGRALESDRALGEDVATSGLSYLSPPEEMLGSLVASPVLQVTANRAMPSITATRWDDEGVVPREFPVVTDGRVQQYFTSRRTAPAIQARSAAEFPESTGCAAAPSAEDPVLVRAPHLTVTPSAARASLDDLCRDIRQGVLVRHAQRVMIDGTLRSGFLQANIMLEVRNGMPVSRLYGNALQFSTPRLWNALATLGDAATVQGCATRTTKGQPDTTMYHSVSAPAGRFKAIDVISTRVGR
jgi:TldD protein